jgi:hypothetical protein
MRKGSEVDTPLSLFFNQEAIPITADFLLAVESLHPASRL